MSKNNGGNTRKSSKQNKYMFIAGKICKKCKNGRLESYVGHNKASKGCVICKTCNFVNF